MLIRNAIRRASDHFGGLGAAHWLRRQRTNILMYHKFPEDNSILESQCRYLRRRYHVLSLSVLSQLLRDGTALPELSVAITVDDGHRSFYKHAFPVFAKYGIPVIVYLVTRPIDEHGWLWFDRVTYAFLRSPLESAALPTLSSSEDPGQSLYAGPEESIALGTREQRADLAERYSERLKSVPAANLLWWVSNLEYCLKVSLPQEPPQEYATLTWQEVRSMDRDSYNIVEFGAHSVTHAILARLETTAQIYDEVAGSKNRIETELDHPIVHFSYPNGQPRDITEESTDIVRKCGYETAVTTSGGHVRRGDDPFLLKRNACDPMLSGWRFRERVAAFGAG